MFFYFRYGHAGLMVMSPLACAIMAGQKGTHEEINMHNELA